MELPIFQSEPEQTKRSVKRNRSAVRKLTWAVPSGPFFFLSYARADREIDQQRVIERFYGDLIEEVASRLGWPPEQIGFLDTHDIETGTAWPEELREALSTCRVLVPVLSPAYFNCEYCGREWAYFVLRVDAAARALGRRPPLIQPVLLVAPHRLKLIPPVVALLQNRSDGYPAGYNKFGLRHVSLIEEPPVYRAFLAVLAERLLDAFDAHDLPAAVGFPEIAAVPSAFHEPGTQIVNVDHAGSPALRFAQFFYVAGRREELAALRDYIECYGDHGGADWQPYMPDVDEAVALLATDVTTKEKLIYESVALDENLIQRLDDAARLHKMVVLIVDSWTIRLPRYRDLIIELDRRNYPNSVVVVPWNPRDPESGPHREDLQKEVLVTFKNRVVSGNPDHFVAGVASPAELRSELARKLQATKGRIEKQLEVTRPAQGAGLTRLPVLSSRGG